jgi:hypothetical protein
MGVLNLVPPLFRSTSYFDNVYFSLLYLLLTYLAISLPIHFKVGKILSKTSISLGAWFCMGFIFELINFFNPNEVYNSMGEDILYLKFTATFVISLIFIITLHKWQSQRTI